MCGVGLESTEAALHGGDERVHALAAHVVAEVVKVDCPEHSPSKALCRYVCCLGSKRLKSINMDPRCLRLYVVCVAKGRKANSLLKMLIY